MQRRVVFLDRDGVINKGTPGYVTCWEEFHFEPGALEAIRLLHAEGFRLFVVTNQSGIGRGLYTREAVDDIHARMLEEIRRAGGDVDGIYVCPHRPDEGCACRKPRPGLLLDAAREHGFETGLSYMVGDKPRDLEAGRSVGARTVYVEQGTNEDFEFTDGNRPEVTCPLLIDAARLIVEEGKAGKG